MKKSITKLKIKLMVWIGYLSECCHAKVVWDSYHDVCSNCQKRA